MGPDAQMARTPDRSGLILWEGLRNPWLGQLLKFLVVGVLNTLVDIGLYLVLTRMLGLASVPSLAKGISYGAGALNSFYWNRTWTFKSRDGAAGTLLRFVLTNLLALAMNASVMHLSLHTVGMSEALALALATTITFLFNFASSKILVFRG